ncbi:MAG: hypothetical protein AAF361_13270 [Bacteroidota bacterium]
MKLQKITPFVLSFLVPVCFWGQTQLKGDNFIVLSEDNKPVAASDTLFNGKTSIKLDGKEQSVAVLKNGNYRNFRVEMDVAGEVMAGLCFHLADNNNYQFIYFRPGLGGTREAIQYIPIYNGALSWVFYNYPKYEKTAEIKSLEWIHAAFEVRGNQLKVFVDGSEEPQMQVSLFEINGNGGNFMLRSLFGTSYFANITVTTLEDAEETKVPDADPQYLTDWEISRQFARDTTPDNFQKVLKKALNENTWKPIDHKKDHFVNFSRYFDYPNGVVVARRKIQSETARTVRLGFDYVGKVQFLLNGQTVFKNNNINFQRMFDGTYELNLPLIKGENELLVIAEGDGAFFGKGFKYLGRFQHTNWGFIASLKDNP